MIKISMINEWDNKTASERFYQCCSSKNWAWKMTLARPFSSEERLFDQAQSIWNSLEDQDWLEAFEGHPRIGDINSLKKKYSTKEWSSEEQSGVDNCPEEVLEELAEYNQKYEERFGYIFIVCATGKTAPEMLALLKARISNEKKEEIRIAAAEQAKITKIRLEKIR